MRGPPYAVWPLGSASFFNGVGIAFFCARWALRSTVGQFIATGSHHCKIACPSESRWALHSCFTHLMCAFSFLVPNIKLCFSLEAPGIALLYKPTDTTNDVAGLKHAAVAWYPLTRPGTPVVGPGPEDTAIRPPDTPEHTRSRPKPHSVSAAEKPMDGITPLCPIIRKWTFPSPCLRRGTHHAADGALYTGYVTWGSRVRRPFWVWRALCLSTRQWTLRTSDASVAHVNGRCVSRWTRRALHTVFHVNGFAHVQRRDAVSSTSQEQRRRQTRRAFLNEPKGGCVVGIFRVTWHAQNTVRPLSHPTWIPARRMETDAVSPSDATLVDPHNATHPV